MNPTTTTAAPNPPPNVDAWLVVGGTLALVVIVVIVIGFLATRARRPGIARQKVINERARKAGVAFERLQRTGTNQFRLNNAVFHSPSWFQRY